MTSLSTAAVVLLLAGPAMATEQSPEYGVCMNAAVSDADFDACSTAEIARQEKALSEAWAAAAGALRGLPAEGALGSPSDLLLEGQRAWLKYRDSSCELYRSGFGREGKVIYYGACKAELIAARVQWLKSLQARVATRK